MPNKSTTRLPAEWEPQSATLIAWPHQSGDFRDNLKAIEETYQVIADTISGEQNLIIMCKDGTHQQHIQRLLNSSDNIHYLNCPYNDIWVRDTAPITIEKENQYYCLNFQFNGWGNKYPYQDDNYINNHLSDSKLFGNTLFKTIDLVLEGGSIESDGRGTLLTTRQCLLNENRNPQLSEQQITKYLKETLGISRILWIDQKALAGDDTDAHIDTLVRFCPGNVIAYTSSDNPDDSHYQDLKIMESQLKTMVNNEAKNYQLVPLPLPKPIFDSSGQQLPANYANFSIINNKVLLPVYNDDNDELVCQQLKRCFPNHKIIKTPCLPLIQEYGSLHCMTMQFPESVFLANNK